MRVRSSLCAFFDEINQGDPRAIADAAYRIANGVDKARMGRELESRSTHCIPGFSTGEEAMVDFLRRNGQTVTAGMRTRNTPLISAATFERLRRDCNIVRVAHQ